MRKQTEQGFSLIELLIVVAIIGILASIAIPALMDAIDRSKQRRSMGDMHTIATANGTYNVDQQDYAPTLADLVGGEYLQVLVTDDAWGNPFVYNSNGDDYDLSSLGSDGAGGPNPPVPWINEPFEPDIIVRNGQFTQAPQGS
ncbi:MAG: type II secretion system protein GspG [Acidobacteriota bacterium]|jgi:prepilin-type N-terminal cleavage/methylation domain-containing protein